MEPLVTPDIDLRGLPFMPLDVQRLRDSDLAIHASGDEFRAAVLLWCAAWNQVPAASLPDDDASLASYAGYGRDLKGWKKVRAGAMRGFVRCTDGRWYHPVVADKAREAWAERVQYRDRRDNESDRLRAHREEHRALREQLRQLGVVLPWNERIDVLRERLQAEQLQRAGGEPERLQERATATDQQQTRTPPETRTGPLPATAKTGTGTGTGTVIEEQELPTSSAQRTALAAVAGQEPDPIFGHGLAFLLAKGVKERGARSFLGAMRKEVGDVRAAELLALAERDDVSDPVAWLRAAAGRDAPTARPAGRALREIR